MSPDVLSYTMWVRSPSLMELLLKQVLIRLVQFTGEIEIALK